MSHPHPFTWRHFEAESILLCVRGYLRYALSSGDREELMRERGLLVDHIPYLNTLVEQDHRAYQTLDQTRTWASFPSRRRGEPCKAMRSCI